MFSSSGTSVTIASTRGIGRPRRAADVADRRPRRQRAERADLGDVRHAVLLLDVLDHLAAPLLAEVDVDIGRFAAASSRNRSNEQVVFQRADVAQVEHVGHQRADADPRAVSRMSCSRAKRTKSQTIEKVVGEAQR